jgi:hypothetical protein
LLGDSAIYENGATEKMSRADYDAGMEHTLNPQGITVNGKSRLTTALLKEIQKREGDPKTMGAPPEDGAPVIDRSVRSVP